MTSRDFCYWLQGFFEIQNPPVLDSAQTDQVKRHLALVFKHEIDPSIHGNIPGLAVEMRSIHDGPTKFKPPGSEPQVRC